MNPRQPIICFSSYSRVAFLLYTLVITFLTMPTIFASYGSNQTDLQALLSFKLMITQDPNRALASWNSSVPFCDWIGITCGKRHRRVTVIQLDSQGLTGSLSPHVGNLSFLRRLSLFNNSFQGSVPQELGRLSRLRNLTLGDNKFSGVIPTNLSACSKLNDLDLWSNKLVGSIPKEISFLSELTIIGLDDNHLTGGIPPCLGNISSMEVFSVAGNPFGGSVPDTLGRWKNLREFNAGECNLHGSIPHSIYNLSLLTVFSLPENQLTSSLPLAIGTTLPHLVALQLRNNNFTGFIPPSISNCSKLQLLEMSENDFSGKLTIDFGELRDIDTISLNNNKLGGHGEADEMKFIDSLKNCSKLEILNLRGCNFQGLFPKSVANLSDHLSYLILAENQLHGNIPSSIGNLVGLTNFHLEGNRFTGKIPFTIGKLQNLGFLYLHQNQFSGPIPDAIGNLSMLNALILDTNRLEGQIPSSIGNCHQLDSLNLGNNFLSGNIPKELLQLPSLTNLLILSLNNFSGSLPVNIGDLKMLTYLDLSYNNFSGNISSSIGGCTSLVYLYLDDNLFQGMIPPSLSSLGGVMALDLSNNNLSGKIPQFLQRFSLEYLNLSFNDFEGEVPVLGVFANKSEFWVEGNSRLCGGLVELGLPKCKEMKKHKKRFPLFVIAILLAFTLFTIFGFVYAWSKKKSKAQPSQSSRNERFLKVSYNQLLKATDGFSEANLIGQGGYSFVYKGILDDANNRVVAVKVLHLQNEGAHRSFMRECEAWRTIRHRNLLKIITSCSSVDHQGNDFKALVYEFMPNGSLHDRLHSSASTSRLDLLQRIGILMDVAVAVNYLHNHCLETIVHGDLKPSNILLDEDMVAHVGDFGLARFLGRGSNQNNSTGVKGTVGYAPPEYGLGSEMTSNGDVYSFGVLLLEVMTGKKPTDDIFNEDLRLHKFALMSLPDQVVNIIDDGAIVEQSTEVKAKKMEECLVSTIHIGVSCSMDSPPQRMSMEHVVHELQHILDVLQSI
uniref:non-specific serine/threonine protein kinase n=1 Tax=Helianthus annuus TaxID=4232 RepID=A0A5J6SDM8_HELAN|nr:receptor-like LRR kinase isoform 1 [Helianthus annuus]